MITDYQFGTLKRLLAQRESLAEAARKTRMHEQTARKYRDTETPPSRQKKSRTWRTHEDAFEEVWPLVEERLEQEANLRALTLFEWLQEKYPGQFQQSQRRTFERRVSAWRALHGPDKAVMFTQVHHPGRLAASDFTCMNALKVTLAGRAFDHMLFHMTLTYSNWEFVSVCFSESFESLSRGLQDALWEMGGAPQRHRSDSLTAAVNNLSDERGFQRRYSELLSHYGMEGERTNAQQPHENGDVESSNGHLKIGVEQALLLRNSRDFADDKEYKQFLQNVMQKRNAARREKFIQEQSMLLALPADRLAYVFRMSNVLVHSNSTIQVKRNAYSVPSRLIGRRVNVDIDADHLDVRHGDVFVQRMPRLPGKGKHLINYRHVIHSLVRKPGAFENYKYHQEMFPSSHFRIAYDVLCENGSGKRAASEYLKILHLAAQDCERELLWGQALFFVFDA